ncbi:hypothetical protein ACFWNZ_34415 [Streptomyces rubiginosohelvolus]|nr:hypothetical protein [Streptomyces sp. 7G]
MDGVELCGGVDALVDGRELDLDEREQLQRLAGLGLEWAKAAG